MNSHFKCIGIIGYLNHSMSLTTHEMLYHWLCHKNYEVLIEHKIAQKLQLTNIITYTIDEIGQKADLAIVVGGDGNMLSAARILSHYNIKVIGINRGNLGFLTDLDPDNAKEQLNNVLKGHYFSEKRFLLEVRIFYKNLKKKVSTAINEIVLHSTKVAHMIEFDVYIDDVFAFSQRADGLIISTPTGSTAYSLSAGGPILIPSLNALTLIPMFPHTLSSRPLVIHSDSSVRLHFLKNKDNLEISCDSQITFPIRKCEYIYIQRCNHYLHLIHPKSYNYFNTLSSKLGWLKKMF